jgi:hypothetical protein
MLKDWDILTLPATSDEQSLVGADPRLAYHSKKTQGRRYRSILMEMIEEYSS